MWLAWTSATTTRLAFVRVRRRSSEYELKQCHQESQTVHGQSSQQHISWWTNPSFDPNSKAFGQTLGFSHELDAHFVSQLERLKQALRRGAKLFGMKAGNTRRAIKVVRRDLQTARLLLGPVLTSFFTNCHLSGSC
jgi:hypothetical protein